MNRVGRVLTPSAGRSWCLSGSEGAALLVTARAARSLVSDHGRLQRRETRKRGSSTERQTSWSGTRAIGSGRNGNVNAAQHVHLPAAADVQDVGSAGTLSPPASFRTLQASWSPLMAALPSGGLD